MYDDYDLDYAFMNEYTYDLDELSYEYLDESACANTTHLDEDDEYVRDSQDYAQLAYRHYA
jgi:hypothetical protein